MIGDEQPQPQHQPELELEPEELARSAAKRQLLEDLDIESFCEEVCGHHGHYHEIRARNTKRFALAPDQDNQNQNHQNQDQEQDRQRLELESEGAQAVTRLKVLLVDEAWDKASGLPEDLQAFAEVSPAESSQFIEPVGYGELQNVVEFDFYQDPDGQLLQNPIQYQHHEQPQHHHHQQQQLQHHQQQPWFAVEHLQFYHEDAEVADDEPEDQQLVLYHQHQQHQQQQRQQFLSTKRPHSQSLTNNNSHEPNNNNLVKLEHQAQSHYPQQQNQNQSTYLPRQSYISRRQSSSSVYPQHQSQPIQQHQQQQWTQQQQQDNDQEEPGNLSWLLDFKLDSFIGETDDKSTIADLVQPSSRNTGGKGKCRSASNSSAGSSSGSHQQNPDHCNTSSHNGTGCNSRSTPGLKKPPYTYTELIEHALQEKGELTVSAIYQWISEHFPYYKSNDDRWKNSVRHNLSINPHFRKGTKAPHGAGHLWSIASKDEDLRSAAFFNIDAIKQACRLEASRSSSSATGKSSKKSVRAVLDEVAAATASITEAPAPVIAPVPESPIRLPKTTTTTTTIATTSLEHSAGRILSGLKREVEVQYVVPTIGQSSFQSRETDFLNPVSKETVAAECGLLGEGYLVTDINPASLGLNMVESEIVSPDDNLFEEELSFQFYELTSPGSQLQSA